MFAIVEEHECVGGELPITRKMREAALVTWFRNFSEIGKCAKVILLD